MRQGLKWAAVLFGISLTTLIGILAFNTIRYVPVAVAEVQKSNIEVDVSRASVALSQAVQFQTISTNPDHPDFDNFLTFLQKTYPAVHSKMQRTLIGGKTPLFKWTGSKDTQNPVLFAAHYDVVPALEDSLDQWEYPPFAGKIANGYVWGRGTLDNKGALIAILEASERLINEGFEPSRTLYFSFGHDEEVGGLGARAVAKYLRANNVHLDWAMDEGSFVLENVIPGLEKPVASINLAEKGYLTLEIAAKGRGGHSALPPKITSVGRVAAAITKLQAAPIPGGLTGVSADFFDSLGRHFSFGRRIIFANRWLFDPLLEKVLSDAPSTNAMLRTTTAPTMLSASQKENVLATEAIATVNFRLHPRDNFESVIGYVRQIIDDELIEIRIGGDSKSLPSPVSSADTSGFRHIEATLHSVFGPLAMVPGLTIGGTDARHYALAAENAYRINPFKVTKDDIRRFHGVGERLSLENLEKGIEFYLLLIKRQ